MDDLSGFVQTLSDDWEVLKLPAIAEIDEDIPISDTKVYHRKAGEALSPEREPISVLEILKLQLGGDAFSAQYQQEPAPPGGAMIKRAWIKRYSELPPAISGFSWFKAGTPQIRAARRTTFPCARLGS